MKSLKVILLRNNIVNDPTNDTDDIKNKKPTKRIDTYDNNSKNPSSPEYTTDRDDTIIPEKATII